MARPRKELHTGDMEVGQSPDIILPELGSGSIVRVNDEIDIIDTPLTNDHMAALAFNEEEMTIRIEPSSEENAPRQVDVYVNGEAKWLPVGIPVKVKRKFVEVLVRSKPDDVRTLHQGPEVERPENRITRNTRSRHPLSVLSDPNPKGAEWLTRLVMER